MTVDREKKEEMSELTRSVAWLVVACLLAGAYWYQEYRVRVLKEEVLQILSVCGGKR